MRKTIQALFIALVAVISMVQVSQAAVGFTVKFLNPTVTGSNFKVDIYLLNTGSTVWRVGNSNFWFTYNSLALSTPTVLTNGIYNAASFNDYNTATLTSGTFSGQHYVSYNVLYNGAGDNFAGQVASSTGNGTLVATLQWTITSATSTTSLAFQTGGYALTTDGGADITNAAGANWTSTVSNQPLPVELVSLTAIAQGANSTIIKWSTATEINNNGFEVERTAKGSTAWAKIGFVAGAGTSNSPKEYSYQDVNVAPGVSVYRLKQVDNGGSFKYSASVEVDAGTAARRLELLNNYPNTFNPATEIRFSVPEDGYATLMVYNMLGQEVATLFSGTARAGHYIAATFNAGKLASGVYISRLEYNGKSLIQRMLLTK